MARKRIFVLTVNFTRTISHALLFDIAYFMLENKNAIRYLCTPIQKKQKQRNVLNAISNAPFVQRFSLVTK